MTRQRVRMTRDKAAKLGGLLQQLAPQAGSRAAQQRLPERLAVQILTEISAGNYAQHDAAIITATGVDTKQRVKVRHVGEGKVTANTIVFPEQCGRHGLCFVRTSNGQPQVTYGVQRFARVVGPIAGEMSGAAAENTDWVLGQSYPQNWLEANTGGAFSGYYAPFTLSSTPDTAGTGPTNGPNSTPARWQLRMKPMRFKVDTPVGPQFGQNYKIRYNRTQATSFRMSYVDEIQQGFGLAVPDNRTVKSGSRLHPMTITSARLPTAAMTCPSALQGPYPEEIAIANGRQYTVRSYVRYARLWIDGVDQTGIVANNSSTGLVQLGTPGNVAYAQVPFCGPFSDQLTFAANAAADKVIEFDLWLWLDIEHLGVSPGPAAFNGTPTRSVAWCMPDCRGMPVELGSADLYSNLPTPARWEFAFSSNGPAGVSTLRSEPTAGWTFQQTTGYFSQTYNSGSGYLSMDWFREIPLIEVRNSFYMSGLYVPDTDSHYGDLLLQNSQAWRPGVWNPNAATTFKLIGSRQYYYQIPYLWLRALDTATNWSSLPDTITVTPY